MNNSDMSLPDMRGLIEDTVRRLGHFRNEATQAKSELDDMLKKLKEGERWQTHDVIYREARERVAELESGLHELAIDYFKRTNVKTAHQAVNVKIMTNVEYDRAKAKEWALEHLPEALKLDKETFEKYAKSVRGIKPLPFVTFKETPKTFINRDLSQYISDF